MIMSTLIVEKFRIANRKALKSHAELPSLSSWKLHLDEHNRTSNRSLRKATTLKMVLIFQLMKHVRLPLISRDFLMTVVDTESLIRESLECKELLLEAMRYHLLPEQRSSLTTERTTLRKPDGMKHYVFAIGKLYKQVFKVSLGNFFG